MRAAALALALAPVVAPITGCADDPAVTPYDHQAGTYDVVFLTEWDQGSCEFDTIYARFDPVSTTVEADAAVGEMAVSFDDGDQTLLCDLDVNAIACEPVVMFDTDLAGDGKDAVVTTTFTLAGDWSGDDAFGGTYTHGFTCDGADCGALDGTAYGAAAAFPCSLGGAYEATLR
jgi:hypothetical protein